jgi:hypothetical protein
MMLRLRRSLVNPLDLSLRYLKQLKTVAATRED